MFVLWRSESFKIREYLIYKHQIQSMFSSKTSTIQFNNCLGQIQSVNSTLLQKKIL